MINTEFSQQRKYENQILCPTSFRRNYSSSNKSPLLKENPWLGPHQKFASSSHIYGSAQHTKEKKYFPAQTNYSTHLLKGFRICIIRTDINTKGFQMKWALKFTSSFSQIPTTKALFKHCKHLSFQPPQQRNYLRHLTLLCHVLCANKSKGLESIISVTWILTKLIIQVNHYEFRTLDWFSIRPNTCIIDLLSKP